MRVLDVILLYLLLCPMFVVGQDERDTIFRNVTISIQSPKTVDNKVAVYESANFSIFVDYKSLISSLKSHIKTHNVDWDKSLLKALQDRSKTIEQRIAAVQSDPLLESRLAFQTMDLLKSGQCIVQNQMNGTVESKIVHQDYQKRWLTGTRFLTVEGQLILDLTTGAF